MQASDEVSRGFEFIIYSKNPEKKSATITLNRPEVMNALNLQIRKEILTILDLVERDDSVRVLVFTGAVRAFSAGADVNMFQTMTPFTAREYLKTSKGTSNRIENFPKPVIAAVNGHAIGGGLELAMSCDVMVASSNAKFGQTEINVGLIPGVGGTQRLPRRIGIQRAKELIFTGDLIDAAEAHGSDREPCVSDKGRNDELREYASRENFFEEPGNPPSRQRSA